MVSSTVPPCGAKGGDLLPELQPALRIEAGGRLVEEQQLGVADQGAGDRQALLLAAGELADARVALLLQGERGERPRRVRAPWR